MVKDVDEYVKSCENCQKNKGCKRSPLGLLYPHERPQKPWQKISLDFIVQLPKTKEGNYDAILTVVDAFSKRMHFIPCFSNLDALGTARLLREHVFKSHGYPMCIVSDRGSIFTSEVWKELFKLLGTRQNLSSSFHPQTDGASEKANDMI
jgi:transposase InsO family protein